MESLPQSLLTDLKNIRTKGPLVLNLTNFVAMDITANALLALGASPIMSYAKEELKELIQISQAVVINIGTLDTLFIESAKFAAEQARAFKKPVVLDPVGVGATKLRTETARTLIRTGAVTVVRGNASEVAALFGNISWTKGVDSVLDPSAVLDLAKKGASQFGLTVTVSGPIDYVISHSKTGQVSHGDPMMTKVTAMGCTASSLTGAFLAVNSDPQEAALNAMMVMGISGEKAKKSSQGPGSFRTAFLDALYSVGT